MPQASTRRRNPAASLEETLCIELVRTADLLSRAPARLLREKNLSPEQYNVLRILRGSPAGLLCGDIASRMITHDPDITRLLDRLEKRGLIRRFRLDSDRRRVKACILPPGLAILARLDEPVRRTHRDQLGHLAPTRLRQMLDMLRACRPTSP